MKALVIGYGNFDRQDDGVAYHVLRVLAERLGAVLPESPADCAEISVQQVVLRCSLQLTPEMAEEFAGFERVVFVDAHTGSVPGDVHLETVKPEFKTSPLTHHLTPAACLSFAQLIHGRAPDALLVSIRGYRFEFSQELSSQTLQLVPEAVRQILCWLQVEPKPHEPVDGAGQS